MKALNLIRIALLLGLAEAVAFGAPSLLLSAPALAQFWGDPFYQPRPQRAIPQQQQQPFNPFGGFFGQPMSRPPTAPRPPRAVLRPPSRPQLGDFSKAPNPRKPETPATTHIVVMGDSLADWLGHGLEEAYADNPEFGVLRKFRADTGLIRNESRNDSYDWVQAARDQLAGEKPDFVVMIIGLSDRVSIRERPSARPASLQGQGQQGQHSRQAQSGAADEGQAKPEQAPSAAATHDFRSEKWGQLYGKRIDDTIAALKSKGVPVLWVGLPQLSGVPQNPEIMPQRPDWLAELVGLELRNVVAQHPFESSLRFPGSSGDGLAATRG